MLVKNADGTPRFRTAFYCEFDAYAQAVLRTRIKHGDLHDAPIWSDVTTFNGRPWRGQVDILAGGFPCQDVSYAGKRAGVKKGTRSGLWAHYARIIRQIRPLGVIVENVPGLLSMGFGRVLGDLARLGYDARWYCLSAAAVGAPHLRNRVWVVAWRRSGLRVAQGDSDGAGRQGAGCGLPAWWPELAGTGLQEGVGLADAKRIGRLHGQAEVEPTDGGKSALRDASSGGEYVSDADKQRLEGSAVSDVGRQEISDSPRNCDGEVLAHPEGLRGEQAERREPTWSDQGGQELVCGVGHVTDSADKEPLWWDRELGDHEASGRVRRDNGAGKTPDGGGERRPAKSYLGGTIDGLAAWLDGINLTPLFEDLINATKKTRPADIVPILRKAIGKEAVDRETRGLYPLSAEEVLRAFVSNVEARAVDESRLQLESKEASKESVRVLRVHKETSRSPRRPKKGKQRPEEHPDSLRSVSLILARYAEKAWAIYRRQNAADILGSWKDGWEDGFSRTSKDIPRRVDRLRLGGNGVVPQQSEPAWRLLSEIAKAQGR